MRGLESSNRPFTGGKCGPGGRSSTSSGIPMAQRLASTPHAMLDELKARLQAEVERLNHEISFVLPKEIEKARDHGDLREHSEYKAALERQQFAQARVHHLRARLGKL